MAKSKKSNTFVWIIVGLLIAGLMSFGATGLRGTLSSIGSAGDKDISLQTYARELSQSIRAFEAQIGQPVAFVQAQALGLDRTVLAQLVTSRTLDNAAAEMGLSVGDARVREQVLQISTFNNMNGEFDREAYRDALSRSNLSEAEFEADLRDEMARTLLQGAVISGVPVPAAYADAITAYIGERRAFTFARIDADQLNTPLGEPDEADLLAQYEATPEAYTLPESREISYVLLTPEMLLETVVVDETELRQAYQERISEYIRPERRLVERLTFADIAAAEAAKGGLDAGVVDFDTLVTDRGLNLADVDLGDVLPEDIGEAAEAVFASQPGDVLGPIETLLGPALFRMNAVLAAQETSFEQAKPELRELRAMARARRVIEDQIDPINDMLAGGATLENLAERSELELGEISFTAETADGIAAYEDFRLTAAAAVEGGFPELLQLEDGGIFALRLNTIVPPTLQPLEEVRERLQNDWQTSAVQAAIMAQAADLVAQITPETDFADLGLEAESLAGETRRGFIDRTPPTFLSEIFLLQPGEAKVVEDASGAVIVRLDGISAADTEGDLAVADRNVISEAAQQGIAQDLFGAFSEALRASTDVTLDQSAINAVHAQLGGTGTGQIPPGIHPPHGEPGHAH